MSEGHTNGQRGGSVEARLSVIETRLESGARRFAELGTRSTFDKWVKGLGLAGLAVAITLGIRILNATDAAKEAVRAVVPVQIEQAGQAARIEAVTQEVNRQGAVIEKFDGKLDTLINGLKTPKKGNK